MNLRIACKILKRHDHEIRMDDLSTVPPRLVERATKRYHKWQRNQRINRDMVLNPAPSDLRNSHFKTRRCQPRAELLKLWKISKAPSQKG